MKNNLVVVRGGGDIASGSIHRLKQAKFDVIVTEIPWPTVIRRRVSYAQALFEGRVCLEGVSAVFVSLDEAESRLKEGVVPIVTEAFDTVLSKFKPIAIVDAILAKKNLGLNKEMAPIVIGVGPGFIAGEDVHAVIETNRGHDLGRVIYRGKAAKNTGIPGNIEGYTRERVIHSPEDGKIKTIRDIGESVKKDEIIAKIKDVPVKSKIDGILRGLIADETMVFKGMKIADVDPRGKPEYCFSMSDKTRAVAGGVLEALLVLNEGHEA